jgi:Txe/YoeB family toxin of Txe-Axe toxin-antitoxin module
MWCTIQTMTLVPFGGKGARRELESLVDGYYSRRTKMLDFCSV